MARTVVVTGGASGIGRVIAQRFADAGYKVHIFDIDAEAVAQALSEHGAFSGTVGDVSEPADVARGLRDAEAAMGQVDVLVNDAAIPGPRAPVEGMPDDEWDRTMRVNLYGPFFWTKAVAPGMKARREGSIVNVSTGSVRTLPLNRSVYNVSKWGVEGLTKTAARELGPWSVRVNAIQPGMVNNERMRLIVKRIARCRHQVLSRPDRYVLVNTVDDILAARRNGKLAVGLHLEGFRCLERDLNLIETYYKLGVRFVHPIFNLVNSIGGGSADRIDIGLTRFGVKVVHEMNRVGMLVDAAHAGYRTTLEMMEVSRAPVIFSHLGCHSIHEHFRNVRDDQIQACAAVGGVIGITSAGFYLGDTSTETYFRHLDHVVQLVGPQHVGIGLDNLDKPGLEFLRRFIDTRPDEWPGRERGLWEPLACFEVEQLPEVTELLLRRGYAEDDVRGILGGNWLRVCRDVWKDPK